jgi:hypothetical protein
MYINIQEEKLQSRDFNTIFKEVESDCESFNNTCQKEINFWDK